MKTWIAAFCFTALGATCAYTALIAQSPPPPLWIPISLINFLLAVVCVSEALTNKKS